MLRKLAAKIDTVGAERRKKHARTGWPARSRDDIRFTDAGGVQFRYRERGTGQTILFVADPPVMLEHYDALLARYAQSFRVVVVEVPAMGFSVANSRYDFSFGATNRALTAFMETIVGPDAITAFSCVAGLSSLRIAADRPDLISGIVLIQTASWSQSVQWKRARDPKRVLAKPILGQLAMRGLRMSRAPLWFGLAVPDKPIAAKFCSCAQEGLEQGAGWALASAFQNYLTDTQPDLPRVEQPMLILWGACDRSHPDTVRDSAREHAAGQVTVREYPELGHFPELEDVGRIHADIATFAHAIASSG